MFGKLDSTLTEKGGKDCLVIQYWYWPSMLIEILYDQFGLNIYLCVLCRQEGSGEPELLNCVET